MHSMNRQRGRIKKALSTDAEDESSNEGRVVPSPNTGVQPLTMVIASVHAIVALQVLCINAHRSEPGNKVNLPSGSV
jgi:hypothetical protein